LRAVQHRHRGAHVRARENVVQQANRVHLRARDRLVRLRRDTWAAGTPRLDADLLLHTLAAGFREVGHRRPKTLALLLPPRRGAPILAVWALGLIVALRIRSAGDRLLLGWVLVLGVFFQAYPLKAFNYLLPMIPALSILASRGLHHVTLALARLHDHRRTRAV